MNLSDIVTRVADATATNSAITTVLNRITRSVNLVCSEIWDGFAWSWRWRNYRIVTDVDVTAGTVTATNGSRVITGVATSFLSSHVTWQINFLQDGIQNWYKVRTYTSATSIELDVPYQGTTGSGKTYVLRHFDYTLPTEPWDIGSLIVTNDRRPVEILELSSMDIIGPVPFYKGSPLAAAIYSSDSAPTVYSTGTIAGTINTSTVTGSGTAWLNNIYPGDTMVIGSYTYQIRSVDTDTQVSLYNYQQVTSTAGTSYTITRQFGRILRIMWPSTDAYTLDLRALRKYVPLVNNSDSNELLYRFPHLVVQSAAANELGYQNDKRSSQLKAEAMQALARARAEDDAMTHRNTVMPIYSYRTDRRGTFGDSIR